jgi:hypothetical protein
MALNPKNRTEAREEVVSASLDEESSKSYRCKSLSAKGVGWTAGTPHSLENTNRLEFGNLTIADEVDAQLKQTDAALHGS